MLYLVHSFREKKGIFCEHQNNTIYIGHNNLFYRFMFQKMRKKRYSVLTKHSEKNIYITGMTNGESNVYF